MRFLSLSNVLAFCPSIGDVLNRRFWYVVCINAFLYAMDLLFLEGGGGTHHSISYYIFKNILENGLLCFCVFYICQLFPFGIFLEYFLAFLFFLIGLVDIFLFLSFSSFLNSIFFTTVLSSNFSEAREFFSFYVLTPKTLLFLGGFVLLSFVFLYPRYKIRIGKFHIAPNIYRILGLIVLLVSFLLLVPRVSKANWLESRSALVRYCLVVSDSIAENNNYIAQYKTLMQTLDENLSKRSDEILSNTLHLPTVVLIIGESTQRNYMSLYGYGLPTTPKLDTLLQSGNLIAFSNVISPHSHTNNSLQKMLTFSNYENTQIPWFMQQNFIDILNLAGYKTHWLSNQEAISIWGNIPEALSRRAQNTRFSSFKTGNDDKMFFDDILLPMLEETLASANSTEKQFYVLHLMGSHISYKNRYPKSFAHFSPQDLRQNGLDILTAETNLNQSQLETKAHYCNAIFYNDEVVSSIIESFADKEALVIYLSDHGDEVYDFRDFVGHTETMGSRFMVEIPFMVYMSESFKQKYPDIFTKVQQAKDKPFMNDDFIHSFLDLLGIVSKDYESSRSIFSPNYNEKRIRIFSGLDYDKDMLSKQEFVPSRLWLHRVDEVAKFEDFKEKYRGFEIDVHFLLNPNPYFDVGHDGADSSIGLNLADMFSRVQKQNMEHLTGDKIQLWIDFKNLSEENKQAALLELQRLCLTYEISPSNLIIESRNYKSLDIFKQSGFFTSYYVPYYKTEYLESHAQAIRDEINTIIESGNVSALSFPLNLYDFIVDSRFGYYENEKWRDMPLLTWNEEANWKTNMQTKAFSNPQIKVILVGEKGSKVYR